jgi:hypothetical protein
MEGPAETESRLTNPFPEFDDVLKCKWNEICESGVLSLLQSSYEEISRPISDKDENNNNNINSKQLKQLDNQVIENSGWYKLVELRDLATNIQPHPYRYSMNQICYHYTHDPKYLYE